MLLQYIGGNYDTTQLVFMKKNTAYYRYYVTFIIFDMHQVRWDVLPRIIRCTDVHSRCIMLIITLCNVYRGYCCIISVLFRRYCTSVFARVGSRSEPLYLMSCSSILKESNVQSWRAIVLQIKNLNVKIVMD